MQMTGSRPRARFCRRLRSAKPKTSEIVSQVAALVKLFSGPSQGFPRRQGAAEVGVEDDLQFLQWTPGANQRSDGSGVWASAVRLTPPRQFKLILGPEPNDCRQNCR